jgi:hypothetical protein
MNLTAPVGTHFSRRSIMEVLQYQVIEAGNGFCIAAFDESIGGFVRLSKEDYRRFEDASDALFSGTWTLA